MKAKISRGNGFRGTLDYVEGPGEKNKPDRAEFIGGNMTGNNPVALSREFSVSRQLRPETKNPCWHCSLTLSPGENISNEKWQAVSKKFLQKMGIDTDKHQYTIVRHDDTAFDHVHLIVSRIGFDGKLWGGANDVKQAIQATQELEKEMGLIQTKGFMGKAEKKSLTPKEIQMSARTGGPVPRATLQNIIQEALKEKPDIPMFLEKMELSGVGIRPNISKTGRMNGFAFEYDGIKFKGSQLGKKFTWVGLQKGGLQYEQERDSAALSAAKEQFDSRSDTRVNREPADSAGGSQSRDQRATSRNYRDERTIFQNSTLLRRNGSESASDNRRSNNNSDESSSREDAGRDRSDDGTVTASRSEYSGPNTNRKSFANTSVKGGQSFKENKKSDGGSRRDDKSQQQQSYQDSGDNRDCGGGDSESRNISPAFNQEPVLKHTSNSNWNKKFKIASAKKKRQKDVPLIERKPQVKRHEIQNARSIDPSAFFSQYGYYAKPVGKQYSIMQGQDEYYRSTYKAGHWVHCDHFGNGIGDNIAMLQHLDSSKSFVEAVYKIHGAPSISSKSNYSENSWTQKQQQAKPVMPVCNEKAEQNGREYLEKRGISQETIQEAEKRGFLAYTMDGVLCVGRDTKNEIRAISRRAISPETVIQKRDLKNSDKSFAPILPGNKNIVIVEGVVDALAVRDISKKQKHETPTVIVSGSASAKGFLEQEHIQTILKDAKKITVCYEHEKTAEIQKKTDNAHDKQVERIQEICPAAEVKKYMPPAGDIADQNAIISTLQEDDDSGLRM